MVRVSSVQVKLMVPHLSYVASDIEAMPLLQYVDVNSEGETVPD